MELEFVIFGLGFKVEGGEEGGNRYWRWWGDLNSGGYGVLVRV